MTRVSFAAALALIVALTAVTPAQSNPDLSGTWSWLAETGATGRPKTLSLKIVQTPGELTVERTIEGAKPPAEKATYKLDGARARWSKGALIVTMTPSGAPKPESHTDVYRIENGDLVVETTKQDASGKVSITKETFRKGK